MFYVVVNAYSHEGSAASDRHSEHRTLKAAQEAADKTWLSGKHRFVYVENGKRKRVYEPFNQNYAWEELNELMSLSEFKNSKGAIQNALELAGKLHVVANTRIGGREWPPPKQLTGALGPRAYEILLDALYWHLKKMHADLGKD